MQEASHIQTLSSWIWILFSVGLVTLITYIYSQGNWKTTSIFALSTAFIAITLSEIIGLNNYLDTHFIGQFDSLGLPYRTTGPGFKMFFATWRIWFLPTFIFSALVAIFFLSMNKNLFATETSTDNISSVDRSSTLATSTNITQRIELETLKHEHTQTKMQLEQALETIKNQLRKNQQLELQIDNGKSSDADKLDALEVQVHSLTIELESKNEMISKLENLLIEQEEELAQEKERARRYCISNS